MPDLGSGARAAFAWGPGVAGSDYGVTIDAYTWRSRIVEVTNNSGATMFCPNNSEAEKSAFYSNVGLSCTTDRDPTLNIGANYTELRKYSSYGCSQDWDVPGSPTAQGFVGTPIGANSPPAGYGTYGLKASEFYKNTQIWGANYYINKGTAGVYNAGGVKTTSATQNNDGAWLIPFVSGWTHYSSSPYLYLYAGAYQFYKAIGTYYT